MPFNPADRRWIPGEHVQDGQSQPCSPHTFRNIHFPLRVSLCNRPGRPGTHSVEPGWPQTHSNLPEAGSRGSFGAPSHTRCLELAFLRPFCVKVLPCESASLMRAKLASEDFSHMPSSCGKATPQPCQDQRLGVTLSQSLFFVLK